MLTARTGRKQETMTSRERIDAVMNGEEPDRFPVWLKMLNKNWRNFQPEPIRSMSNLELQQRVGCDPMEGLGVRVRNNMPHVNRQVEQKENIRTTLVQTPD
mgnify:FL=1